MSNNAHGNTTVGYFYIVKNLTLKPDLNGRVVRLNVRHEDHPNLIGPLDGLEVAGRWLTQDAFNAS